MLCLRRALTARLRNHGPAPACAVAQSGAAPFRLQPSLPRTAFGRGSGPVGYGSEGASTPLTHGVRRRRMAAIDTAAKAAICSLAPRVLSAPSQPDTAPRAVRQRRRRHGHEPVSAHATVAPRDMRAERTVHHAQRASCPVLMRNLAPRAAYGLSQHAVPGACTQQAPWPVHVRGYSSRTVPAREPSPCPVLFY